MSRINMAINGELEREVAAIESDYRKWLKRYEEAQVFPAHTLALIQAIKGRLKTYDVAKCLEIIKHASPNTFSDYPEPLLAAAGRVLFAELSSKYIPQDEKEW